MQCESIDSQYCHTGSIYTHDIQANIEFPKIDKQINIVACVLYPTRFIYDTAQWRLLYGIGILGTACMVSSRCGTISRVMPNLCDWGENTKTKKNYIHRSSLLRVLFTLRVTSFMTIKFDCPLVTCQNKIADIY